jgi:hypothetical protein
MYLTQCPHCEHVNPPSSKYCTACGVRLHALLCPQCGAINDATAPHCRKCTAGFLDSGTDDLAPQPAAEGGTGPPGRTSVPALGPGHVDGAAQETQADVEPSAYVVQFEPDGTVNIGCWSEPPSEIDAGTGVAEPRSSELAPMVLGAPYPATQAVRGLTPRDGNSAAIAASAVTSVPAAPLKALEPRPMIVAGLAITAGVAVASFYLFRQETAVRLTSIPIAGTEADVRYDRSEPTALLRRDTDVVSEAAATSTLKFAETRALPAVAARPAASPQSSMADLVQDTPVAGLPANKPRGHRVGSPSAEAAAAVAAALARPRSGTAAAATPLQPPQLGPCTDGVAALGLCSPEPSPRRP